MMADADSREQWERDKGPVLRMLTLSEDEQFLYKNRQLEEYTRATAQHRFFSEAGKRSGEVRRRKTSERRSNKVQTMLERGSNNQNQNQNQKDQDLLSKPDGLDGAEEGDSTPDEAQRKRLRVVQEVFAYFIEQTGRTAKLYTLTPLRRQKGLARLKDCLKRTGGDLERAKQLLRMCVDELAASDWHMGRDPKTGGKKYAEWEHHLFPSTEKLETWWNRNGERAQ